MTAPVPPGVPALELDGVCKSFGAVQALLPLHLVLPPGELLAVLGPSGCGKTTTLRIVAGFEAPDAGRVRIDGRDVTAQPPNRRGLGMVFQNYSLFPHMTVGENVAYGLRMRGDGKAARTARVRAMLDTVRLGGMEERGIHQLSGGQQQRVALARALAPGPGVLLLDEPLGALDKNLREGMQFELRRIQRELGITSILVTHDQEEALTMSDRVAVMAAGRVVQAGPPAAVYGMPRSRFVAEFLGTANILPATVTEPAEGGWAVRLDGSDAAGVAQGPGTVARGQRVLLAVRPERLRIGPPGQPGTLPARVHDAVFRGATVACELHAPGRAEPLVAYTGPGARAAPGDAVGLSWEAGAAVILDDPP